MTFPHKGHIEPRPAAELGPKMAPPPAPRDVGHGVESDTLFDFNQVR